MSLSRIVPAIFLYFCLATVIAEAAALGTFWHRGIITREKIIQLLAVSRDVDLPSMWEQMAGKSQSPEEARTAFHHLLKDRALRSADLDLLEMAADKGIFGIRQLDDALERERTQYAFLKNSFDKRLEQLRQGAVDSSLQEVRRQLESIQPRAAKDQILRILDDESIPAENAMHFVVAVFKSMPLEKRKRILAEFKSDEMDRLHTILNEIRLGVPEITLILETRDRLKEFEKDNDKRSLTASQSG